MLLRGHPDFSILATSSHFFRGSKRKQKEVTGINQPLSGHFLSCCLILASSTRIAGLLLGGMDCLLLTLALVTLHMCRLAYCCAGFYLKLRKTLQIRSVR